MPETRPAPRGKRIVKKIKGVWLVLGEDGEPRVPWGLASWAQAMCWALPEKEADVFRKQHRVL